MNIREASSLLRILPFRMLRALLGILPGGSISAFGRGEKKIGSILIINLERQPVRWRRILREIGRFRNHEGKPLTSMTARLKAIDARDGRAVAATADVDPKYRLRDQLHVQPDARLLAFFDPNETVFMTRQEVAVARSHIEAWKRVATGAHEHVLVLEDDVWFRRGAGNAIEKGWKAAWERTKKSGGPNFLYLSYSDAGGTAERAEPCSALFRPVRGLWYLSGYVLSREGAAQLLRAMPVVGPVDTWINRQFESLGVLALESPAVLQRPDSGSDNAYSVLPYLARAGIVDAGSGPKPPTSTHAGPVLAWSAGGDREGLAMALAMLGLRVCVFDADDGPMSYEEMLDLCETFDAIVDARFLPSTLAAVAREARFKFLFESGANMANEAALAEVSSDRFATLPEGDKTKDGWQLVCGLLSLPIPPEPFPFGAQRNKRLFRNDRSARLGTATSGKPMLNISFDDSPWILPREQSWRPHEPDRQSLWRTEGGDNEVSAKGPGSYFQPMSETFPGNLATFAREGIVNDESGCRLILNKLREGDSRYRSGAFVSPDRFLYGRFEAEIKAARGDGLVTGFFVSRDTPRQEIDIEFLGNDPCAMLVNVYFNPGDEGAALAFGYLGTPWRIELGFDSTAAFHHYAIDWRPGRIAWAVDGNIVHERKGWDPSPIPHLPMRLYGNLWAPRARKLAGQIVEEDLPSTAIFKNLAIDKDQ